MRHWTEDDEGEGLEGMPIEEVESADGAEVARLACEILGIPAAEAR